MFDHIGLRVADLAAASRFYAAALTPLGLTRGAAGDGYAGFGPPGAPALWLHAVPRDQAGAAHVALRAPDRAAVDAFHRAALAAGARDNGAPGLRTDYAPDYYAAFVVDPEGNNLEAVVTG